MNSNIIGGRHKTEFLPTAGKADEKTCTSPVKAHSPCPCCGHITIPGGGNALAYICPVCLWEIDTFITGADEPSDQNHGLTLAQARENYKKYGAVSERLARYARKPTAEEM